MKLELARNTLNTTTRNMKHISEYEGSPCLNCVVKMVCTKSVIRQSACQNYRDFIMGNIQAIREGKVYENEK